MNGNQVNMRGALCAAIAMLAALFSATAGATNYDGSLDASWLPGTHEAGEPGLFVDFIQLGGGGANHDNDFAMATALQADRKVLAAGYSWTNSNGADHYTCTLMRYNPDGSIDTGFGVDGRAWMDFVFGSTVANCYFRSVAVQADGSILAAGQIAALDGSAFQGFVLRYTSSGLLDTSFASPDGFLTQGDDVRQILPYNGGSIAVGSYVRSGFTDDDFHATVLGADGTVAQTLEHHFDLGGNKNDRASAGVITRYFECTGTPIVCHTYDDFYVVGTASAANWSSGNARAECAVAVFSSTDGGSFSVDSGFNGSGSASFDLPVGSGDTETLCYAAATQPPSGFGPIGIVVGGERYYSHAGTGAYDTSAFALASVDASGSVTPRVPSVFDAYFQDFDTAGAYNAINGMAWADGKLIVVGLAGMAASVDPAHAPADMGVMRFNADYTADPTFGNAGNLGRAILSLDGVLFGGGATGMYEFATGIAIDGAKGRAIVVGSAKENFAGTPDYDFELGAIHLNDTIFASGFD